MSKIMWRGREIDKGMIDAMRAVREKAMQEMKDRVLDEMCDPNGPVESVDERIKALMKMKPFSPLSGIFTTADLREIADLPPDETIAIPEGFSMQPEIDLTKVRLVQAEGPPNWGALQPPPPEETVDDPVIVKN